MRIAPNDKIEINDCFKINAGPGAGKTHFIINHIKNIIYNSSKLYKSRKILCITYTNTSVETILKRLGKNASNRVSVLTIHSFLYNYIIKPYASFIPTEYKLNAKKINGHDDAYVKREHVETWLNNIPKPFPKEINSISQIVKLPKNYLCLRKWLLSTKFSLENDTIKTKNKFFFNDIQGANIKTDTLKFLDEFILDYFKYHWKNGEIFHEDVLFFSYTLITKNPFILNTIIAQFPYIILDEYQDTSPIQSFIINKIREKGAIIGVVGDKAQAIYSFQGADVNIFENFHVKESRNYIIETNFRSCKTIVNFLNEIRSDIRQISHNVEDEGLVGVIVGEKNNAYLEAINISSDSNVISLSRKNVVSNELKKNINRHIDFKALKHTFSESDSNSIRHKTILQLIEAVELARNLKFKDSIKKIEKINLSILDKKSKIVFLIQNLLLKYEQYSNSPIIYFHELITTELGINLSSLKKGKALDFYRSTLYENLAIGTDIPDDLSSHITIHKSKGNEFNSVLIIDGGHNKSFLLSPDLSKEEHRILYVAASRSKKNLFIHIEDLSEQNERKIKKMYNDIKIIRI